MRFLEASNGLFMLSNIRAQKIHVLKFFPIKLQWHTWILTFFYTT